MFESINILDATIYLLFFFTAVADYSELAYFLQLKSYNWSRIKDFLSTKQGQNFINFRYGLFTRLITVFILILIANTVYFKPAIAVVLGATVFIYFILFIRKKFHRPTFSINSTIIILLALCFEIILFFFINDLRIALIVFVLRILLISGIVGLLYMLNEIKMKYLIYKAKNKVKKQKNLIVIGITGSYGKTSVKDFLYQILSAKYKVVKTPKNRNTTYAITKFILNTDLSKYDIFIVEIGAYIKGDVMKSASIVNPKIGILSAIGPQHLSLFKTMKNIKETKFDILRIVPDIGLAVTNSDNKYCRDGLEDLSATVRTFGLESKYNPHLLITDVNESSKGKIEFKGVMNEKSFSMTALIPGQHNALNIASCIIVADYLGMGLDTIADEVKKLNLPERTLSRFNYGNAIILDDSYNSNTEGFKSALQTLKKFPSGKERIVITRGVLELGKLSEEEHEKIGEDIAFVSDHLVIITEDHVKALKRGVGDKYNTKISIITDPSKLQEFIRSIKDKDAVVLLENKIPEFIHKEMMAESNK